MLSGSSWEGKKKTDTLFILVTAHIHINSVVENIQFTVCRRVHIRCSKQTLPRHSHASSTSCPIYPTPTPQRHCFLLSRTSNFPITAAMWGLGPGGRMERYDHGDPLFRVDWQGGDCKETGAYDSRQAEQCPNLQHGFFWHLHTIVMHVHVLSLEERALIWPIPEKLEFVIREQCLFTEALVSQGTAS